MEIFQNLGGFPTLEKTRDDSLTDRLCHRFTVILLIVFTFIVSAKQYVGEPINCWAPAHFSEIWEDYTDSYCWVKNTYFLPFQNKIPIEHEPHKQDTTITYYQWVPIMLFVQALAFSLPGVLWRVYNVKSGLDITNLVNACLAFQRREKASQKLQALDFITDLIIRFVEYQREYKSVLFNRRISKVVCFAFKRGKSIYLVSLYLLIKLLYISNIIGQFFLMNAFLGTNYHEYGVKFFRMLYLQDTEEISVQAFPRVTMCDFKIRMLGNVQNYTVQCVLPINLFNGMIYLFLWWWLVFLGAATICSFFNWLRKIVSKNDQLQFIKKHLMLLERIESENEIQEKRRESEYLSVEFSECSDEFFEPVLQQPTAKPEGKYANLKKMIKEKYGKMTYKINLCPKEEKDNKLLHEILQIHPNDARKNFKVLDSNWHNICERFLSFLQADGLFVLRIIGNNTNSITITEVICALWDKYCERDFGKLI